MCTLQWQVNSHSFIQSFSQSFTVKYSCALGESVSQNNREVSLVTNVFYYYFKPRLLVADFATLFKINCRMFWLYPTLLQVLWVNGGHCDPMSQ